MKRSNIALSPPLANFEPSLFLSFSLSLPLSFHPVHRSLPQYCLRRGNACTRHRLCARVTSGWLSRNLVEEAFAHVYRNLAPRSLETLHD